MSTTTYEKGTGRARSYADMTAHRNNDMSFEREEKVKFQIPLTNLDVET